MRCKDAAGSMSDYLAGSLAETAAAELESHLACCPACAAEVSRTRRRVASLTSLSGERSPIDLWAGARARIMAAQTVKALWWRWVIRPVVAAPTAAVMALLALFILWPSPDAPMDKAFAPEYTYYIGAHSHLQRQQAFVDPDVVFVGAELQKSSLVANSEVE